MKMIIEPSQNAVKRECRYCGEFMGEGSPRDMNIHYHTPQHMLNFLNYKNNYSAVKTFLADLDLLPSSNIKPTLCCSACNMKFSSEKAFIHHNNSKKHLKNSEKAIKRDKKLINTTQEEKQEEKSEHSSDYEDIEQLEKCVLCRHECEDEKLSDHYEKDHKYPIPHFIVQSGLSEFFMKKVFNHYYKDKSCPKCFKSFLDVIHLQNHIQDTSHFSYSKEFIEYFIDDMSNILDVQTYQNMIKLYQQEPKIDNKLFLITPSKKLTHRKFVHETRPTRDLEIIPKLHLTVKQIKELERIPVDYYAIGQSLGKEIKETKLKQLVLHELSRHACVSTETPFELTKCDKEKSSALRVQQRSNLHIGTQFNKVQRPRPKKLMFM